MNIEIEYRFLITKEKFLEIQSKVLPKVINQAYVVKEKLFHIRVRIVEFEGKIESSLTTKVGKKPAREEYETTIDLDHARVLMEKAKTRLVKWRYEVYDEFNQKWEIDYYPEEQIVVAELEVPSLEYIVKKPSWVGKEVTYDNNFSNTKLAK